MIHTKEALLYPKELVTLAPFTRAITEKMVTWFMDPEIMQWMYPGSGDTTAEDIQGWVDRILGDPKKHFFVIESDAEPIGIISVKQFAGMPTVGEIGIAIGEKQFQEKGIGKKSVAKMLEFAKNDLKMTDLIAVINPNNIRSIKLFSGAGFQKTDVVIEGMHTYLKTL